MCGIAGVLYRDPRRVPETAVLARMGTAIAHRGPDGEGLFCGEGIGLVHRRLSIIDIEGGRQPMANEDGSIQVVFNGEIYNFCQLRRDLAARGHCLRTRSDTEVLAHLYEDEGDDLVRRLRGMFAFAVWDGPRRRLTLARDRVGLKPLYVYRDDEKLVFGSELKAILAHGGIDRSVDPTAIEDYLAFGVIPGAACIFRNARKLLPAHVLTVQAGAWDHRPRRYWQLSAETDAKPTLPEWREALGAKVLETVAAHQIADVPVGTLLSGGVDSSVLLAVQAGLGAGPLRTFSLGFAERGFSELPQARALARQFGTRHTEQVVVPATAGLLADLVRFYDEPFADSSAIPMLWLSRLARESVKVVISGDGGDEAFGGYRRYAHDLGEAALRRHLTPCVQRWLLQPLGAYWPKSDWLPRFLRAKTLLQNLAMPAGSAYANTLAVCRAAQRRRLLTRDFLRELNGYYPEARVASLFARAPGDDPLAGMLTVDANMLLPDDFLTKVDRAGMSCGLEVRPPLADHELLELATAIPSSWKVHQGKTKWIFKELYRDRLPAEVLDRPKHGFEVPIDGWLRGPLRDAFHSAVLSPGGSIAAWIDQRRARRLYRAHRAGVGRHGGLLWALLVLACWADEYLKH